MRTSSPVGPVYLPGGVSKEMVEPLFNIRGWYETPLTSPPSRCIPTCFLTCASIGSTIMKFITLLGEGLLAVGHPLWNLFLAFLIRLSFFVPYQTNIASRTFFG